jgi:hypothetical protein
LVKCRNEYVEILTAEDAEFAEKQGDRRMEAGK